MRIANNASGSDRRGFPNWTLGLFCWFNHSCDPNVTRGRRGGILTDEDKVARRDIEKGEEAFVSYIDVSADKAARAMDLMAWFGEECKCERCKREV
jgi:SET domain-containing protein